MRIYIRNRASFSLIELIVVVAILSILATMIFTFVPRLRDKGRDAQCKSNLKQLQVASMSYFQEHKRLPYAWNREYYDEYQEKWIEQPGWVRWLNYPAGHDPKSPTKPWPTATANPNRPKWWGLKGLTSVTNGALWQYTGKDLGVYLCPTFELKKVVGVRDPLNSKFDEDNPMVRSYAMNKGADGVDWRAGTVHVEASKLLMFADMHLSKDRKVDGKQVCRFGLMDNPASENHRAWDGMLEGGQDGNNKYPIEAVGDYHDGYANAIFVDGHIERLTWVDTTNACSAKW